MLITNNGVFSFVIVCLLSHLTYGIDSTQNGTLKSPTTGANATLPAIPKVIVEGAKKIKDSTNKDSSVEIVKAPDASTITPDPDPPAPPPSTSVLPPSSTVSSSAAPISTSSIAPPSKNVTTLNPSPISNVSTTIITPTAPPSTPQQNRQFDGPSFIGGIILTTGLMAISFVAFKFYKARTERNYHTL